MAQTSRASMSAKGFTSPVAVTRKSLFSPLGATMRSLPKPRHGEHDAALHLGQGLHLPAT